MTRLFCVFGLFVILNISTLPVLGETNEGDGILGCFYEKNSLGCVKNRADAELDRIEIEVTGNKSSVTFSKVLEEAGAMLIDGTQTLLGQNDESVKDVAESEDVVDEDSGISEARKQKFGKKKKKHLLKLIPLIMLFKAKISLLLQLISTHFQFKFFAIAVISLLVNLARFWIDLKQNHHPAKVVYYEHAQHQHHYENDQDEHGGAYWKRSADASPQELAYNAYADERS